MVAHWYYRLGHVWIIKQALHASSIDSPNDNTFPITIYNPTIYFRHAEPKIES